ncbi:FAD-binding oxidoreductase [Arenibacter sp. ARW7G5Y1]|uniref:NAD(P)/FAD-dependent oxidoreductase n=1 Tax=Arenibacter sp. ARW7G5Y1 TaxID=2135619 RepID=UPI000D760BC9|nr:FAD-binding oxidoreductase [Arenibacter sp. ARW7G5Y1]PXX25991.1 4-methylaminobutanoate oxidase (formaldehyde-forming) [Arenibacter sp. ARW7G5Y1]
MMALDNYLKYRSLMKGRSVEKFDLVIIGGGIFGCAIAYYYTKNNPEKQVVLLERNELNNAATSRAAALMTMVRSKRAYIPLTIETFKVAKDMEVELGETLDFKEVGMMHVAASEAKVRDLAKLMEIAKEYNQEAYYLTKEEAQNKTPWLKVDEALKIGFVPNEAYCDPYMLGTFFARCAKNRGAKIRLGVEVIGLIHDGGTVKGVKTSEAVIMAETVVDAAGVWAPLLAKEMGVGLPMAPVRSQYWITERADIFPANSPMVLLPDAQAYARPEGGGLLFGIREGKSLVASPKDVPRDISDFVFSADEGMEDLFENGERLARFFPAIYDMGIKYYVAGFSGYTPDSQLVLGDVPGTKGFLVASGCCGAGISVAGGVGLGIAEMASGRPNPLDFSAFEISRFGDIDPFSEEWLNKCASSRSNKVSG